MIYAKLGTRQATYQAEGDDNVFYCIHLYSSIIAVFYNIRKFQNALEKGHSDYFDHDGLNDQRYKVYLSYY